MTAGDWAWEFVEGLDMADHAVRVGVGLCDTTRFVIQVGRRTPVWLAQATATQLVLNLNLAIDADQAVEHTLPAIGPHNDVLPLVTGWTDTAHGMQVTIRVGGPHDTVVLPDGTAGQLVDALRRIIREWLNSDVELS